MKYVWEWRGGGCVMWCVCLGKVGFPCRGTCASTNPTGVVLYAYVPLAFLSRVLVWLQRGQHSVGVAQWLRGRVVPCGGRGAAGGAVGEAHYRA